MILFTNDFDIVALSVNEEVEPNPASRQVPTPTVGGVGLGRRPARMCEIRFRASAAALSSYGVLSTVAALVAPSLSIRGGVCSGDAPYNDLTRQEFGHLHLLLL